MEYSGFLAGISYRDSLWLIRSLYVEGVMMIRHSRLVVFILSTTLVLQTDLSQEGCKRKKCSHCFSPAQFHSTAVPFGSII